MTVPVKKTMYELKIISQFSGAHQLREYGGKCERLHGHNWKIEVCIKGSKLGEDGMLIDFGLVKEAAKKVLSDLDHQFLNELEPFKKVNPSSENIAQYLYAALGRDLNNDRIRVSKVTAWESDSTCATYMEP